VTDRGAGGAFAARTIRLGVARLVTLAALFAVSVLAARALDTEQVGAVAVGQTVGLFAAMLANGGLNISTVYFVRRRPDDRGALVGALTAMAIASALLAVVLALIAAPIVFAAVLERPDWGLLAAAALVGAGIIGFEFAGALLLGIDRPGAFTVIELVRGLGALAATVVGLLLMREAWIVVAAVGAGSVAAAVGGLRAASATVRPRVHLDVDLARRSLGFGLRGQAGNVFQYLGLRLDLLLVPAIVGLHAGGIYFVVVRVAEVVGQIATAAASFLFPDVAGAADRGSTLTTERATRMTLLLVIVAALAVGIVAGPLLGFVFGPAYASGAPVLLIALAAMVPLSLCRMIASDLKGRGRPGLASLGSAVMAAGIVVLDLALIPPWGLIGAAVASLAAYGLSAVALLAAYRHVTGAHLGALVPGLADAQAGLAFAGHALRRRRAA